MFLWRAQRGWKISFEHTSILKTWTVTKRKLIGRLGFSCIHTELWAAGLVCLSSTKCHCPIVQSGFYGAACWHSGVEWNSKGSNFVFSLFFIFFHFSTVVFSILHSLVYSLECSLVYSVVQTVTVGVRHSRWSHIVIVTKFKVWRMAKACPCI